MVDEAVFRNAERATNPYPCIFGKAILACRCACSLVKKRYLAERETLVCADAPAQAACEQLHDLLLHNAAFTLKHIHDAAPITHAQEMKLQCGGLQGVQLAVDGTDAITDVSQLIVAARHKFGGLQAFPYAQIIQAIAASKMRKRHRED